MAGLHPSVINSIATNSRNNNSTLTDTNPYEDPTAISWEGKPTPIIPSDYSPSSFDPNASGMFQSRSASNPISAEIADPATEVSFAEHTIGESVASSIGGGIVESIPEIGAIVAAVKTAGTLAEDPLANSLTSTYSAENQANLQQHGVDVLRQSAMINNANSTNFENTMRNMDVGSWFGPLGSYLGYAFSSTDSASSLNMNTAYSNSGMVNPELYSTVSTGYASDPAVDNQSVMSS
uniref:Uncharacterized protein n=1 Tax=Cacaos virus TaxID=2689365 RepID=A0A6B9KLA2_9VIRU|nr:hypothetical protein 3 [Cacaos virus]